MNRKQVFQDRDFQRAFELEAGREEEGWTKTGTWTESSEFWKKVDYDATVPLHLKGRIRLNNVPLEKCRQLLTNVDLRSKWDGAYFDVKHLERNPYYSTIYWIFHLPPYVQDRDMIQHTAIKWIPDKKAYVILYKHGEHPSKPESSDYIRMKTGFSYTILRRAEDDPKSTIMSSMGNNDYGGWLPHFLMGGIYAKSITKLGQRLTKAYRDCSEHCTQFQKSAAVQKQTQTSSFVFAASEQYNRTLIVRDQR